MIDKPYRVVTFILFGACALSLALASVMYPLLPAEWAAFFESVPGKAFVVYLGTVVLFCGMISVVLHAYTPTVRRLCYSLLCWACAMCVMTLIGVAGTSVEFELSRDIKKLSWSDCSVGFELAATVAAFLVFIYLLFCKYEALGNASTAATEKPNR